MRAHFVLSEIGVGLRRNLTMTFAVIVSVALSLALLGGSLLANQQVNSMKDFWYDKVQVSIFLCNENDADNAPQCARGAVTEDQKEEILGELEASAGIRVDFFFAGRGLVVEVEGHRWHGGAPAHQRDTVRFNRLMSLPGVRGILRFTAQDVFRRPRWMVRTIRGALVREPDDRPGPPLPRG